MGGEGGFFANKNRIFGAYNLLTVERMRRNHLRIDLFFSEIDRVHPNNYAVAHLRSLVIFSLVGGRGVVFARLLYSRWKTGR